MAKYYFAGSAISQAYLKNTGTLASHLLYVTPKGFGFINDDGSKSYVTGTNFSFDPVSGEFISGTVTSFAHFTPSGQFIESLTGITDVNALYSVTSLLRGYPASDWLPALFGGDDLIDTSFHLANGYIINDIISAGAGNDKIYSGDGSDRVHGDTGNDTIYAGTGNDFVFGDAGNDTLFGEGGNDVLAGGMGENWINGGNGVDTAAYFGKFSDLKITISATEMTVKSYNNTLDHLVGIERIAADDGTYLFNAVTKTWSLINNVSGIALIDPSKVQYGTAGADTINFTNNDLNGLNQSAVYGLAGNDVIHLDAQNVPAETQFTAFGGDGGDRIDAVGSLSSSSVVIYGDAGNDVLIGGYGSDALDGGAGNDVLYDAKYSGFPAGITQNILIGAAGTDTAVFNGKFSDLKIVVGSVGIDVTSFDGRLVDRLYSVERIATDDGIFQYNSATASWSDVSASIGVANGATLLNGGAIQNGTAAADVLTLDTGSASAVINGLGGDDTINFLGFSTQAYPHDITVYGGAGNDTIDTSNIVLSVNLVGIYGGNGNDILTGSARIDGGAGNDTITGGVLHDDLLTGGTGADTFRFVAITVPYIHGTLTQGWGHDIITDFVIGTDHLKSSLSSAYIQDTSSGLLISFYQGSGGADILLNGVHSTTVTIADLFI